MSHSKLDNYVVLETIGQGAFGVRQKISRISDEALFEWQEINYRSMDFEAKEKLVHEIDSLKKLRHPNVVHYEDGIVKRETNTLYLITECCGNDTLQTLIDLHQEKKKLIHENVIWTVLSQLCHGLQSLSSTPNTSKISHHCLKPSSIYFRKDTMKIKLGNFGLGLTSKAHYKCPELEQSGVLNEKTDVWFMGCVIYELCCLKKPFGNVKDESYESTQWRFGNLPLSYTNEISSMLRFILTADQHNRPSALMILHHPIMKTKNENEMNVAHSVSRTCGILETDFPVTKDTTHQLFNEPMSYSDLSLNHYLSMIGDDESSVLDDVDICSIENGTALPKATSSILLHSSPYTKKEQSNQMESHLYRWAKMLEEKEKELAHKERRLFLWETQLHEMELSRQEQRNQNQVKNGEGSVGSDAESDANSTMSTYPGDSILVPTAVRMEPSKIRNPFTHYNYEKHVRFRDDCLELKAHKNLTAIATLSDHVASDYVVLEEKSIASSHHRRHRVKSNAPLTPKSFIARKQLPDLMQKENVADELNCERSRHAPRFTRPVVKINDSKILSNELRAKLKSHNLPGLR